LVVSAAASVVRSLLGEVPDSRASGEAKADVTVAAKGTAV
jgi:hypothetical protein